MENSETVENAESAAVSAVFAEAWRSVVKPTKNVDENPQTGALVCVTYKARRQIGRKTRLVLHNKVHHQNRTNRQQNHESSNQRQIGCDPVLRFRSLRFGRRSGSSWRGLEGRCRGWWRRRRWRWCDGAGRLARQHRVHLAAIQKHGEFAARTGLVPNRRHDGGRDSRFVAGRTECGRDGRSHDRRHDHSWRNRARSKRIGLKRCRRRSANRRDRRSRGRRNHRFRKYRRSRGRAVGWAWGRRRHTAKYLCERTRRL